MASGRALSVVVRPWYRQFYLRRGDCGWPADAVSAEGYEAGLEAIDGFVCVGVTMYGSPTRLRLRALSRRPAPLVDVDRSAVTLLRARETG